MRRFKKEEEINPWTFRHRYTQESFHQPQNQTKSPKQQVRVVREAPKLIPIHPSPSCKKQPAAEMRSIIPSHQERTHSYIIPKLSLEQKALEQIEKTLPCFTSINFESHLKTLKCKSNQNRFCFVTGPTRRKSEGVEALLKRQGKQLLPLEDKTSIRRYHTELKQSSEESEDGDVIHSFTDLLTISSVAPAAIPLKLPIKIIRTIKNTHAEEAVTKGRLFEDVMAICHSKNISGGGHLSQMKRTYNLKRLERLIKPTHLS